MKQIYAKDNQLWPEGLSLNGFERVHCRREVDMSRCAEIDSYIGSDGAGEDIHN